MMINRSNPRKREKSTNCEHFLREPGFTATRKWFHPWNDIFLHNRNTFSSLLGSLCESNKNSCLIDCLCLGWLYNYRMRLTLWIPLCSWKIYLPLGNQTRYYHQNYKTFCKTFFSITVVFFNNKATNFHRSVAWGGFHSIFMPIMIQCFVETQPREHKDENGMEWKQSLFFQ